MYADIDECRRSDLHTCVNARCDNTNGSFVCTCNPGFMSDGSNSCIGKYQLLLSTLIIRRGIPYYNNQMLMSVKQTLPLVMRMLTVLILWEASTVVVGVDSFVYVSKIN